MRNTQFSNNLIKVENALGISKEIIFDKSKNIDSVEARDLLFYLCRKQHMRASTILGFCQKLGFNTHISQITRATQKMESKMSKDNMWNILVKDL
tara:strand:- start:41110 stop:41394 length:285 start_codon:yes stop_codon:yes gene_type:complete